MVTDSGYRPPEPAGTGSRSLLAVLILVALVLAIGALVVSAGILLFRVLAAADDEPTSRQPVSTATTSATGPSRVELADPLEIHLVTSATPGTCPAGSDGYTVTEPAECLELGGGFAVRELQDVSTGLSNNQQVVRMQFMPAYREALAELTRKALGQRMALVHEDKVIMAAQVNDPIEGGALDIAGNFTAAEAEALAARLHGE